MGGYDNWMTKYYNLHLSGEVPRYGADVFPIHNVLSRGSAAMLLCCLQELHVEYHQLSWVCADFSTPHLLTCYCFLPKTGGMVHCLLLPSILFDNL